MSKKDTTINFSFKKAARCVLKEAAEEFKKENKFSVAILLKLRSTFGTTFERALELFESKKVSLFTSNSKTVKNVRDPCCFYEVKGQNTEVYTILPNVNFCSCLAFEKQVLREQNAFTCKHILAVWLTTVDSDSLSSQPIPESKFCEILQERFTF